MVMISPLKLPGSLSAGISSTLSTVKNTVEEFTPETSPSATTGAGSSAAVVTAPDGPDVSATGASTTGASTTGASVTAASATGSSITGSSATGAGASSCARVIVTISPLKSPGTFSAGISSPEAKVWFTIEMFAPEVNGCSAIGATSAGSV